MRVTFLMTQKIVSYSDAMEMPYDRFVALEKMFSLATDIKAGKATVKPAGKAESANFQGLQSVSLKDLDLPEHYMDILL